jgi:hypothetical protein
MKKNKQKTSGKLEEVVYVSWEESERGWGVRPDGCSLHKTQDEFETFLEKYWAGMPDEVPDEYSRPTGEPVKAYVTKTLYEEIKKSRNGIRLWSSEETRAVKAKQLVYGSERSGWVEYK